MFTQSEKYRTGALLWCWSYKGQYILIYAYRMNIFNIDEIIVFNIINATTDLYIIRRSIHAEIILSVGKDPVLYFVGLDPSYSRTLIRATVTALKRSNLGKSRMYSVHSRVMFRFSFYPFHFPLVYYISYVFIAYSQISSFLPLPCFLLYKYLFLYTTPWAMPTIPITYSCPPNK